MSALERRQSTGGLSMTCQITGDAVVTATYPDPARPGHRELHWDRADPEIHVAAELLDDMDARGREFLTAMYEIGEWCSHMPKIRHARRRREPT